MIKYRHFQRLVKIQNILRKELSYFPLDRCCESSRAVAWTLGLEQVAGTYQDGWHAWNYDRLEDKWVDISFRQFHSKSPRILVVPAQHRFFKECEQETARQKRTNLPEMDILAPLLEHLAVV